MEYTDSPLNRYGVRCFNPEGHLKTLSQYLQFSHAITVPANCSTVITSGQLGFREDLTLEPDVEAQVTLAFANAEKTLQAAGVTEGWKAVYHMTTYSPSLDDDFVAIIMAAKVKYLGDNWPTWTGIKAELHGGAVLEMTLQAVLEPKEAFVLTAKNEGI